MELLKKIELFIGEEGEVVSPGTTSQDVAKVPQGTKKSFGKKKKGDEEEEDDKEIEKDSKEADKKERKRDVRRNIIGQD